MTGDYTKKVSGLVFNVSKHFSLTADTHHWHKLEKSLRLKA